MKLQYEFKLPRYVELFISYTIIIEIIKCHFVIIEIQLTARGQGVHIYPTGRGNMDPYINQCENVILKYFTCINDGVAHKYSSANL